MLLLRQPLLQVKKVCLQARDLTGLGARLDLLRPLPPAAAAAQRPAPQAGGARRASAC